MKGFAFLTRAFTCACAGTFRLAETQKLGSANSRNKNWGKAEQGTLREMIVSRPAPPPYPVWPCGCHGLWLSVPKMRYLGPGPCLNVGDQPWGLLPAVLWGTRCSLSPRRGSAGGTRALSWWLWAAGCPAATMGAGSTHPRAAQSPRHAATKHGVLREPPAPPGAQHPPSHPPVGNALGPMRKDGAGTGCPGTRSRHATLGTMPRTSSSQSCELTTRSCFLLKFCTSTSADPQRGCDGHGAPWQGAVPAARCRCPGLSALCRQQRGQASAAPRPLPQDAAQHPARLSSTLCQQEPL